MFKPELLSPAGSFEKMVTAISYGADAVYLAGQKYGLRSAADNFSIDEIEKAVEFAHARKAKIYVVLNSFLHDADMRDLSQFVRQCERHRVDGVIVSDLGVVSVVAQCSSIPIHLSTQASCLNEHSGQIWKKMGVKRLIFGREVSIEQAGRIKRATGLEVELFIHGSMCMAYSGNCTISNFTKGRDSNRGGCAQSCRFEYNLDISDGPSPGARALSGASSEVAVGAVNGSHGTQKRDHTFFMSSKDLMGIELIPDFVEAQIDSVKIEGRMRSPLYAGMISKIYREALDEFSDEFSAEFGAEYQQGGAQLAQRSQWVGYAQKWSDDLERLPHRDYMTGSLEQPASESSVFNEGKPESVRPTYQILAVTKKVVTKTPTARESFVLAEVRGPFSNTDEVMAVPFRGPMVSLAGLNHVSGNGNSEGSGGNGRTVGLGNALGVPLEKAKASTLVRLPYYEAAAPGQIITKLGSASAARSEKISEVVSAEPVAEADTVPATGAMGEPGLGVAQ